MRSGILDIEKYLETEFERELFKASVSYLCSENDPLRFNSFAYSMRELYRHVLSRLSPEEEIVKCEWFKIKDSNEGKSTRRQKLVYAIQGGLTDKYVKDELGIEIDEFWSGISKSQDLLSKYTHVNESTFNIPDDKCNKFASEVLSSLETIFAVISDTKAEVISQLYQHISNELVSTFISNTMSDIDILSTHTYVEDVEIEECEIIKIDSTNIYFSGHGNIHVSLNYGSDKDEPTELQDEFPFDFRFLSPVHKPELIQITPEDISIDTSSWFGDDDDINMSIENSEEFQVDVNFTSFF